MPPILAALLAAAVLASTATAASAGTGTFIGIGLGTTPATSDSLKGTIDPEGRSLRLDGGLTFQKLALEAGIQGVGTQTSHGDDKLYMAFLAGKLTFPLGSGFSAFGRVGVQHTWGDAAGRTENDGRTFGGSGLLGPSPRPRP